MNFKTKLLIFTVIIVFVTVISCLIAVRYLAVKSFVNYLNQQEISRVLEPMPKRDLKVIAEYLEMDEEELKKDLIFLKNNDGDIRSYLKDKGVTKEIMGKLLPPHRFEKGIKEWRLEILTTPLFQEGSPESHFTSRIFTSIILTGLAVLFVMLLLVFHFSSVLSKPILNIIEALKRLKDKDKPIILEVDSNDEVGLLANIVNELSWKLSKQEKIRSHFLTDISHEIKTPLTSLKCYMEGLKDGVFKPNIELYNKLLDELERVCNMVDSLMHQAKYEIEGVKLSKNKEDIVKIIIENDEHQQPMLKRSNQESSIKKNGNINKISIDKNKIIQVIQNIYSNFSKYAGENKKLEVRISQNKKNTIINFRDNGVGVSEEEIKFICEKFYQTDKARSGDYKERGLGVGLSIVKAIVEAHKGYVLIKSRCKKYFEICVVLPNI